MIAVVAMSLVVLAAWIYLLSARARLAEASLLDLFETRDTPERWPPVSVIIPARNEVSALRLTLPSLLSFYYPQAEIILVDDCSTDGTAEVAAQIAAAQGRENLRVVTGTEPPPGWRGKLWAIEQGVRASIGEWLLFFDADITCTPYLPRDLIRFAMKQGFQMASAMVLLRVESFWDRLLVPAFVFFFHLLYPFDRVARGRSAVAAAAGGCILVERAALDAAGGLEAVRDAWIDDVALARAMKRSGAKVYLGVTVQAMSVRRYGTLKSIRQMVARSAFTQLRYSWGLVAITLLAMAILFGVPFMTAVVLTTRLVIIDSPDLAYVLGASAGFSLGFMITSYAPFLRLYRLPIIWGLTLPAAAVLYAAMTVESGLLHTFGRGPEWKGRRGDAG